MTLEWRDSLDTVDWNELSELYRVAPLGIKPAEHLRTVFGFMRMKPAMAIFENQPLALERGYLSEN